ncbi:glycosyltransferase family 1 protein [Bacillus luteolus]|uniref:Glycosyltransferase family 1 protein n=1 Tax=Litchfieldia luteola TaxID=682179 RepID=A0ABR9QPZ3_9BACI|nr:glycosyltransferase [Cytobacillus luteolus]MBE4910579.1 glycosyltransferase family 1 protein [Cytobacillus luteolus]MBP1943756.1 sterol 3beta-glucosyltransferase [Cytobacillus luteolus]
MITILCAGSRGDFQPYIALAQQLKKLGKNVRITGLRDMEEFVRSYGIEYFSIQADFKTLNVDEKMLKEAQSADNPLKMLLTFNKMRKYGVSIANEYYASCKNSELIIYHPGVTLGYFAAEKLGIPSILASPFPMHKTKKQTSIIQYGRKKSTPITNIISYYMLQGMLWLASKDSVKGFWKKEFGGLPEKFGCPYERHTDKKHPAIISCSNYVFKRPSDWNENIHQHGYWFVEEETNYIPSKELEDFLHSGDKPIYIGFGSVFHDDQKEALTTIIVDALAKSGKRGIICGMGKIHNLPKNIIAIDSIPHTWLFERVAAVCHHGGAGTTAAGFKAGVPSIIVPFANDQHAWAHRAYDLSVGSKPIPIKALTSDNLATAIHYALEEKIVENSKTLAKNIATENGVRDCARVIVESLMA